MYLDSTLLHKHGGARERIEEIEEDEKMAVILCGGGQYCQMSEMITRRVDAQRRKTRMLREAHHLSRTVRVDFKAKSRTPRQVS